MIPTKSVCSKIEIREVTPDLDEVAKWDRNGIKTGVEYVPAGDGVRIAHALIPNPDKEWLGERRYRFTAKRTEAAAHDDRA